MEFLNQTPFPAIAFSGIDQHGQTFDVVVLRQTLSFASGHLEYADIQSPLCEVDAPFDAVPNCDIRQESDLVPFKPRCDVIVNATAFSPDGKPCRAIDVRMVVSMADDTDSVPIIDKSLRIHGERHFVRHAWWLRACLRLSSLCTLGWLQAAPWRQTTPASFYSAPVRYSLAYGGECRIDASASAAERVPREHQLAKPSSAAGVAVAHVLFEFNPGGLGYAPDWAVRAQGLSSVPAPRLERPDEPCTAKMFWHWQRTATGTLTYASERYRAATQPAGFGIRPKTHPDRTHLLGTVDASFTTSEAPLPADFDFGYYNAAPPDQQISYLRNDELIRLHNLCPPDSPGSERDAHGDTVTRLSLLRHECFCLLRLEDGRPGTEPMLLDTVVIEPDDHSMVLVWRLALLRDHSMPVRACEARMWSHEERDRIHATQAALAELKARGGRHLNAQPDEVLA